MEIPLAPELEAKLQKVASQAGKGVSQVVGELVAKYLDYDQWFRQQVEQGLASLEQNKSLSQEEVRERIQPFLNRK